MMPEGTGIRAEVLGQICDMASGCGVERVILFGSRARGDHLPKSDIDLAVKGGDTAAFAACVSEETDTLLRFDVLDLGSSTDEEILSEISRDGIVLYEKV